LPYHPAARHACDMTVTTEPVGALIRHWRQRRHLSQLELSLAADVSARHLSFVETGRAMPSRDMIERLCGELDVPLRERNTFHLAAGFAPAHAERKLSDLGAARRAIDTVLRGLEPNPAVAVNVRWDLVAANRAAEVFLAGVPETLRRPPINMLRMTLAPDGLAGQIRNLAAWRDQVLRRVRRQLDRPRTRVSPPCSTNLPAIPHRPGSAGVTRNRSMILSSR
jgi:transcriptional regulator with XRE-family HTH domain